MATANQNREASKKNNSLRDFQGVNTQAARQVIGDDQFSWLENVQPIGFGNMPTVPAPSASLVSWGGTAYQMQSVNIAGTDYMLVFTTAGAAYWITLGTYTLNLVAVAGTFSNSGVTVAQWENAEAIIVDPTKGYFQWDPTGGLVNLNGQVQTLTVTTIGTGYTSAPTLGFSGGGGTGAGGTIAINVGLGTLTAAGTGYNVGDPLTIVGGTFTTPAQFSVATTSSGGVITGINLVNSGTYTIAPSPLTGVTTTSPYGTGAQFTLNFGIGPILTTVPGSGYTSAPTVALSGGGGSNGVVTAALAVVPSGGTAVATYQNRVWVASNRTVVFSAPGSYTNFSSTASGGSFIVADETLHSNITSLVAANNFLYILGTSSINVIADVAVTTVGATTTSAGIATTVFSNTNISASIGTNQQASVIPYYRALWFAAPYGIFALYGSTTQKASDDLDGIFSLITSAIPVSAGVAVINKINVLCFMFKYADPTPNASPRTILACYANKKWFFASQGNTLTFAESVVINGTPTMFATDGTHLYQLFAQPLVAIPQTIKTKLWDMGDPLSNKQVIKLGMEVVNPSVPQTITGTVDTEIADGGVPYSFSPQQYVTWVNNLGIAVQWWNNSNQVVQWLSSGYLFFAQDLQTTGRYIGVTVNGNSAGTVYAGLHLQYEMRTPWPEGGAM